MPSNWYPIQATRAYLDLNTADRAAAARCPQCNAHPDSFEFDKDSLAVPLVCYGGHSWQIAKAALVPERREQVNHPEHYGGDVPHEVVKCRMTERVSIVTQSADGGEVLKQINEYMLSTRSSPGGELLINFRAVKWRVLTYSFPFGEIILERVNQKGIKNMAEETKTLTLQADAEFGKQLVQAAHAKRQQRHSDQVVHIVDTLLEGIEVNSRRIAFHEQLVKSLQARIAAIEAGEFVLSARGELTYLNDKLNAPIPVMIPADTEFERYMNNTGRRV